MHLVVAGEDGGEIDRLQNEIRQLDLDWRVTWLPLGDEATVSAVDLAPDALVCPAGSGWNRCQLLLDQVREQRPHAARIITMHDGHDAKAAHALELAHRVLPEPLDAMTLVEAIQGVLDLHSLLEDPALKRSIERVGALPSAPRQYLALTRLLRDPDVGPAAIIEVIGQDPALAARVLRLCNSAYYAIGRDIGDLRTAVIRLGQDALRRLVLASEVFAAGADMEGVRARSLRISWLSGQLLPGTGSGLAATAGLMAEVGQLLPPLSVQEGQPPAPYSVAGAYLLGMWGLPTPIVEAVAFQREPGRIPGPFWITGAVHVAASLVNDVPVDEDYLRKVGKLQQLPQWRALADADADPPLVAAH